MPKRKASTAVGLEAVNDNHAAIIPPPAKRRSSRKYIPEIKAETANPEVNHDVLDAADAVRASPGASARDDAFREDKVQANDDDNDSVPSLTKSEDTGSDLSDLPDELEAVATKPARPLKRPGKTGKSTDQTSKTKSKQPLPESRPVQAKEQFLDPDADDMVEADDEEVQLAMTRPPPVNSSVLPLPWEGRLGYACLNTYLRFSNPPVFASRTCRIASILENRHPLKFPDQPPHPTKNRPDKDQPASVERGQRYVESLGLANARDCVKMLEWNEKYGIRFLRLSSEMFPFASHEEYGYKLAPFASEVLADVGRTAAKLGHRLTTHPGQFTQLGSPRQVVIDNAIRDLEYHQELLSLLKLPPQQDRDAVMIMHLGGVFGDKEATIQRFRENYERLPDRIKKRLVLENDDVSYSVHDLLPLCEELNIPMVLDFHHHNIIFDSDMIREGTKDIIDLFPRILATWRRKNITPKMHYSEPTPAAITRMQRRKHNPRVATLPPCPRDMDLMIEAKDKEQAVFELMRTFKLPGHDTFSDIIPHVRNDENKPVKATRSKSKKKQEEADDVPPPPPEVPEHEVGMGGPDGRVYWPPGMEEWLRPKKRVIEKKSDGESTKGKTISKRKATATDKAPTGDRTANGETMNGATTTTTSSTAKAKTKRQAAKAENAAQNVTPSKAPRKRAAKALEKEATSSDEVESDVDVQPQRPRPGRRVSRKQVNYAVDQSE